MGFVLSPTTSWPRGVRNFFCLATSLHVASRFTLPTHVNRIPRRAQHLPLAYPHGEAGTRVQLFDDIPSPDSTLRRVHGIDSGHMKRAALYARASTDRQTPPARGVGREGVKVHL